MNLTKVPCLQYVQKVVDFLTEWKLISSNEDTKVFNEFSIKSNFITAQKVTE